MASASVIWGQGVIAVRFDRAVYQVLPQQVFTVSAVIDPVPGAGLYSFGLRLNFDPRKVHFSSTAPVVVPPTLNFNGVLGQGVLVETGEGWIGVKGTVDFAVLPIEAHRGESLATFQLQEAGGLNGEVSNLAWEFYRTVGPSETLFVDGLGNDLDGRISFGTAQLQVIPEPRTWQVLGLASVLMAATKLGPKLGALLGRGVERGGGA